MTTLRFLAALLPLLCLAGAGCEPPDDDPAGDAGGGADPAAGAAPVDYEQVLAPFVIGRVDWRETTRLGTNNPAREASRAVGLLQLPAAGVRCTAFLVAPDVILTNHHCVASAAEARDAVAVFNYDAETPLGELEPYPCETFLGSDDALDFALLRCDAVDGVRPGDRHGVASLSGAVPEPGASVYMIHQNCDWVTKPECDHTKKYSPGTVLAVRGSRLLHTCDGLGGSSGAAVFDRMTHRVIGLHHAGYGDPETGRGECNEAILVRDLLTVLESDFPDVLDARGPPDGRGGTDAQPPVGDPGAVRMWPVRWESAHPYGHEAGFERRFDVPGAARVRVHFARIDTEEGYDPILVRGAGAEERYSGPRGEVTTGWFAGDAVTVRFESDESVAGWGFLVDAVDWVP